MIIKQCVKLKGKPSYERKKQVGEHTRNMAHCTKERKTLNWLLHLHCEKCHFIRTSVSALPRSILINYFNLNGPISILTLFYAPLKYRILNDRALQQNKNTFFIMKVKLSNQHSHFPCTWFLGMFTNLFLSLRTGLPFQSNIRLPLTSLSHCLLVIFSTKGNSP